MADTVDGPRETTITTSIVVGVAVALNVLFLWLSGKYFDDRAVLHGAPSPGEIEGVRIAFGVFTGLTAGLLCVAVRWPRFIGHAIPMILSLMAIVGGRFALRADLHVVLPATLLLIGGLLPALIRSSLKGSRAGWAFLIAMCAMLAVVMLFGSTKVRNVLHIGLWYAMILPGMLAVATTALVMIRTSYRDP